MPEYSTKSIEKLLTCNLDLQRIFYEVIKHVDCKIIEGHRTHERQNELYEIGQSQLKAGQSKHNVMKEINGTIHSYSEAVDVAPWFPGGVGIRWQDAQTQIYFAGIVKGISIGMRIPIRCGVDWNQNINVSDNWIDAYHFELI